MSDREWVKVNLNDTIRFKVTQMGLREAKKRHDVENAELGGFLGDFDPPVVDAEGWSKGQLWWVMERFGRYCQMGANNPLHTEIEIFAKKSAKQ